MRLIVQHLITQRVMCTLIRVTIHLTSAVSLMTALARSLAHMTRSHELYTSRMNTPDNCNCNTSAIASAVAPAPMMSTRSSEEQLPVVMPLQTSRPVTAAPVLSLREARGTYLSTAPMEGQGLEVAMATAIASHYELASVREEVTTILRASTLPVSRVPVLLTGRQQDETPGQLYRETSDYNRGLSSRIRMTTEDAARVFPTSKTGLYYTKQSIRRERQYFSFFDVSPAKMAINTAKTDISPAKTDISKIDIGPAKSMVPVALDNDRARHERVNKAAIEDASHAASAAPHVSEVQLRERVVQRLREFVEEGRCSEELLHEVTRQLQAVSAGETSVHAGSVTVPSIGKSALLADSPAKNVLKSAKVVEKEFVDADAVGNANATADNVHPIQKHESMFSMFTTGSKNLRRALTFGSHKRSSLTGNGSRKSVSSDSAATNFAISTNDISPTGPKRVDSDNDLDDEVSILNKSPTAAASSHGSKIYAAYQLALRAGVHASDADELQLKRLGVTSITCKISSHGHRVSKVKSNGSGTQIVKEYSPDIFRRLRAAQNCGEELTVGSGDG